MGKQLGMLLAASAISILAIGPIARSSALEYSPPPYLECFNAATSVEGVIEHSRQPAGGAQASFGAPMTFSANATVPVTFVLASNAGMTPPYLDEATVTPDSSGVASFTSSKATSVTGGVWWTASFSTSSIPECLGQTPKIVTLASLSFTVLAPPAPPVPPPSTTTTTTNDAVPVVGPARVATCIVPDLRGLRLPNARALLLRHSCKLGRVGPASHLRTKGAVVVEQGLAAGSRRHGGTAVDVTLGTPRRHRR